MLYGPINTDKMVRDAHSTKLSGQLVKLSNDQTIKLAESLKPYNQFVKQM